MGFDSPRPPQILSVAKLDKAPAYEAGGRTFESYWARRARTGAIWSPWPAPPFGADRQREPLTGGLFAWAHLVAEQAQRGAMAPPRRWQRLDISMPMRTSCPQALKRSL